MDKYHTPQNAVNEGIVLAHTLYGAPSELTARPEGVGPNAARATWSTAPYIPPKRRGNDSADRERPLCSEPECKAWPIKDRPYCAGHARKHGLLPSCKLNTCNANPMGTTGFCYYHQPKAMRSVAVDDIPE